MSAPVHRPPTPTPQAGGGLSPAAWPRLTLRLGLLGLLGLAACFPEDDPCEGRRDLTQSLAGLELTEVEHGQGWGRTDCAQCHPAWTVHQADCIDGVAVDVEAIEATKPEDCVVCHGANGVAAWQDEEE